MTRTEIPQAALWPCQSVVDVRSGPRAGIDPASSTSMATPRRSGDPGWPESYTARQSNPVTTKPNRHRTSSRTSATRIPRHSDSVVERSVSMRERKQTNAQGGCDQLSLLIGRGGSAPSNSRLTPLAARAHVPKCASRCQSRSQSPARRAGLHRQPCESIRPARLGCDLSSCSNSRGSSRNSSNTSSETTRSARAKPPLGARAGSVMDPHSYNLLARRTVHLSVRRRQSASRPRCS
jgi:hypothetical protein